MELAGGLKMEDPAFTAYGANLTPDVETGIGGWSDAEIVTAIREGRRPDGSMIGPIMPIALHSRMSDRDVRAIVAYLRPEGRRVGKEGVRTCRARVSPHHNKKQ